MTSMLDGLKGQAVAFADVIDKLDCKPRTVQLEIDGLMYTSTKLPADLGLEIWPRCVVMFGAGLARALSTGDLASVGIQGIVAFASQASADGLMPLFRDLLARMKCGQLHTTKQPGKVLDDFAEHFAGEYPHLIKVVAFAMAHNLKGPTLGGL